MNRIEAVELIQEKRGPDKEFLVTLFENCNLSCSFCLQDHASTVGMDTVVSKFESIMEKVSYTSNNVINFTGGELFHDGVADSLFDDYVTLCSKLADAIPYCELNFVTNFIFVKQARVWDLLFRLEEKGVNIKLSSSYDPRGRFNKEHLALFMDNVILFKEYIRSFQVTMTRPNIEWFMKGTIDPLFEYIYSNYALYFDHYTPGPPDSPFICTERDIVDFYIYMAKHYPDIQPLRGWIYDEKVVTTCRSTVVILPTGEVATCRSLLTTDPVVDYDAGQVIKERLETAFVNKYDCSNCAYFSRCSMSCFLHHEFAHNDEPTCQYKRLHHYIEENIHA